MSPGVGEEASKVVSDAIGALKSTPVVFAILVFNVLLLASVIYMTERDSARWERVTTEMLKTCQPRG